MKILPITQSRQNYINLQIKRSNLKFAFCKVSINHVLRWKKYFLKLIKNKKLNKNILDGPIVCFGTRNGREIDLFRKAFYSNYFILKIVQLFEVKKNGWRSFFPLLERLGKSDYSKIKKNSVIGVEINPLGSRKDVITCSFDELPSDWENKYNIIYSNSFDQSQDPIRTAKEWIRVAKKNALIIISFSDSEPTETDPIGNITLHDLLEIFPGELLFYEKYGSRYHDLIIKINK